VLLDHQGKRPSIHPTAYVAPTATLCGDVTVGPHARVLFGSVLSAEGGSIELGAHDIVMENAVLRGAKHHPLRLGNNVLVGPQAYLSGCVIEQDVFLATGTRVFNGATVKARAEVRVNAVVHLRTVVPEDALVPIGWVAVGDPAQILPPSQHDDIWRTQEPLDFPKFVFGLERTANAGNITPLLTERYSRALARHLDDQSVD
jgi:carbonic anhydrase/acetyltransferase-like protein (isoleucine patch superfamily)